MQYHIARDGQTYGPYTLEDLRRYVASGNVLPTDMAKSEDMPDWAPVSQILGAPAGSVPNPGGLPAAYPGTGIPGAAGALVGAAVYPDPPNLHWALVLLISIFTCGLFGVVWQFVQAAWMRRVNPRSNALFFYIGQAVLSFGGSFARIGLMAASGFRHRYAGIGGGLSLVSLVLLELAFFDMRRSMEEHFNGPEPIGLSLSGLMTFFFGPFYFQYHMSRINELKRIARYRGAVI